jgi:WD40 repeat protein
MLLETQQRSPFVGPRPFEPQDRDLFFGRDREADELVSLIVAHRLVLVYAQSGAGKTSLLNAELVPRLVEEGFEVLPLARVRGLLPEGISPHDVQNLYAFNSLMSWAEEGTSPARLAQMSLADFLRQRERPHDDRGLRSPRVIIFDQFEELFTFYPERWRDRAGFFQQVAEALEADPLLRAAFVMREDYIAQLDPYSHLLPERLRIRYRLERLRRDAALAAVRGPLKDTDRSFAEGAAERLVEELLKVRVATASGDAVEVEGEFVEPVQLQVVCDSLWQSLPPGVAEITQEHLQAFGDINQALAGFYERSIRRAAHETGVKENDLREWFERSLITPAGTRGTVFRGRDETGGIPNAAVDVLENLHLVRAELRAGARWYELNHDRFIEPIRSANAAHRQRVRGQRSRLATILRMAVGIVGFGLLTWFVIQSFLVETPVEAFVSILEPEDNTTIAVGDNFTGVAAYIGKERITSAQVDYGDGAVESLAPQAAQEQAAQESNTVKFRLRHRYTVAGDYHVAVRATEEDGDVHEGALGVFVRQAIVLRGHKLDVTDLAFSPDGHWLATSSHDGSALLWDLTASNPAAAPTVLPHNGNSVSSIAFSLDSRLVATGSQDSNARLWDLTVPDFAVKFITFPGHTGAVRAVALDPDGRWLATGGDDATPRLWDLTQGAGESIALRGHEGLVLALAFSLDGRWLATGSTDAKVRLWELSNLAAGPVVLQGHENYVNSLAFHPDGRRLASGSLDKSVKLWQLDNPEAGYSLLGDLTAPIAATAFSPDGRWLATGSTDNAVRLWDLSTEGSNPIVLRGHDDAVQAVAFSADGRWLASGSQDTTARLWDLQAVVTR